MSSHYVNLAGIDRSKQVRSMDRAKVTIANWSLEQLAIWLEKANKRGILYSYKYRRMVEAAILNTMPNQ